MKKGLLKRTFSVIAAVAMLSSNFAALSVPVFADTVSIEPDTGAVGSISNGGDWSIYAKYSAQLGINGNAGNGNVTDGRCTVTGSANIAAALQFDLSTMNDNGAKTDGQVIKNAKLRLTPVVTKGTRSHGLYVIGNDWNDADIVTDDEISAIMSEKKLVQSSFTVPRNGYDDFNTNKSDIYGKTADDIAGAGVYPDYLSKWQTNLDITGDVIASDGTISLYVESNEPSSGDKTEYSNTRISKNSRLTGNQIPFLYNSGATDYSKWIYPQIVFTYTDDADYLKAYEDFVKANTALSNAGVTVGNPVSAPTVDNGSTVTLELAGDEEQAAVVENNQIIANESYIGSELSANVLLTVTNNEAVYSRIVSVPVNVEPSYEIKYSTEKNPKGEINVSVGETAATDGVGYAKAGDTFTVNITPNTGYSANVTVKKESDNSTIEAVDGVYTMPAENVSVDVTYTKPIFGTTRIAAINSVGINSAGTLSGNTESGRMTMAAGRIAFLKFDLSEYDIERISKAELSLPSDKSYNATSKALFYVPNNDWTESSMKTTFMHLKPVKQQIIYLQIKVQ